ncbi:MAG: branched-chain-amino-acid transaminase [Candidatus Margulisiibacteriota bacterium]|nr:branched-chain-amino-acid transaminase [Candidatus Margulisiibacteriota bacterium]
MKIFIDGKIIPSEKATISVFDRGLFYGDGVFESLRTYNGKAFQLDEHLKRLVKGTKSLKIRLPYSIKQLKQAVVKTIAANKFEESYIKIIVTRGKSMGHGLDPRNVEGKATLIIIVEKQKVFSQKIYSSGWKAIISSVKKANVPISKIKSLNYLDNILAKIEANKTGANEAILLDEKGNIAEGTISNIFIVKHGTIYTPPADSPILPGLTRKLTIKLARQSAFKIIEKVISPKELYTADECFITFSGAGVVPITRIWNKKISKGKCGPITSGLIGLYAAETKKI